MNLTLLPFSYTHFARLFWVFARLFLCRVMHFKFFGYKKSLKNSHLCVQERFMKKGEVKESVCEDTRELGATQTFAQQTHTVSQPSFSNSPPPAASLFVRCGSQHLHVTFQPQTLPLTHTHTHAHTPFLCLTFLWCSFHCSGTGSSYTHTLTFFME